ncbi:sensor histidine kinase [Cohnella silvisoli]|uniref:histidine kinase n=1 Tax=Cohnella silvisoli TaxID=2873699 RepID=A0ABV1KPB2_9BACL|nr:GAF domain-containing sensor histidine kinase [Cohnella silvisoli]MCD9020367.1 GAF domain-containing sensor histidine kinase [Cohnella silvisoli]
MNRKWYLIGLHILWWVILFMALSVFVVSKWEGYSLLQVPCGQSPHCDGLMYLTDDTAADLQGYGLSTSFYSGLLVVFMSISNISYLAIGALLYRYRSQDVYGILASLFLIIIGTIFCSDDQALRPYPLIYTFFTTLNNVGSFYLPFLFLFPDGKFTPRWTAFPATIWVTVQSYRFIYPATWESLNWDPLFMTVLLLVTHGPLVYSLIYRCRRSLTASERRHIKWFMFSVLCYVTGGLMLALQYVLHDGLLQLVFHVFFYAGLLFWPFSIGIGVLERQSESVSARLSRTFLVSVLGFILVMLYAATVGGFSMLLRQDDLLVALVATGIVVVVFHPLHIRLQRGINRLVYGEPQTPYQILTRLVDRMDKVMEQQSVWTDVVRGIAQALQLPYTAIRIHGSEASELAAEYGQQGHDVTEIPLQWNSEEVGVLILGVSRLPDTMSKETEELLYHLVRQVSVAVRAARLTEELKQSRERLVYAREEERRRLGRDLHDGLGAGMASILLRADAIADRYDHDALLTEQLNGVQTGIEEAISDIRRLVYTLRPPVLDEFGLLFAVQELAIRYEGADFHVSVSTPKPLPVLSTAAEVAIYRIIQEALTNAIRHGAASQVQIAFTKFDGWLKLIVKDNGVGFRKPFVPGIGVRSMRERAEELGGRCELIHSEGEGPGTEVHVFIPYRVEADRDGMARA